MALGAMERFDIPVTIQCVGLNYYRGYQFRSNTAREPAAVEAATSSPAVPHHDNTSCSGPVARHPAHPLAASSKRASDGKACI